MTALEALESYSGSHPEPVEDLLCWPYRRFRKAFSAWQTREAIRAWEERKIAHVSALYANSGLDPEKLPRLIADTEEWYEEVKADLTRTDAERAAEAAAMDTPFMRAGRVSVERVRQRATFSMPGEQSVARLPAG